ncbi:hypothetical protein ACFL6R_02455 [Gemmatimonadota bacterium]
MEQGISIEKVQHGQYFEQYKFRKGEETASLQMYYKKDGTFTKINVMPEHGDSRELQQFVADVMALMSTVRSVDTDTPFPEPPPGREFLGVFFNEILNAVDNTDLTIVQVEHLDWAERYTFQGEGEYLKIDFFFDKKGVFTRTMFVGGYTGSRDLIDSVNNLIQKLNSEER